MATRFRARERFDELKTDRRGGLTWAYAAKRSSVDTAPENLPTTVRLFFLLFIFMLPLDAGDLSFLSNYVTVTKIVGILFFASYLFHYCGPVCHRRSFSPPSAAWWFLGYVAIYSLHGLFMTDLESQFFQRLVTLVQLVIFLWLSSRLLQNERLGREALLGYALGTVLVALSVLAQSIDGDRLSALGESPNNLANVLAIGAVIVIGLRLGSKFQFPGSHVWLPILLLPILAAIVYTGSRTGLLTVLFGMLACLLLASPRGKKTAVALVIPFLLATMYMAASNPVSAHRWHLTFEESDLARRDKIFYNAIEMFTERPLFGWHPVELWDELGRRTKAMWKQTDTHNLYLHLLLEVGVLGAFPFFAGIWLCTRAAWKGRAGYLGPLPLALLVGILLGCNMALTWLARKPMWFVLALCLAVGRMGVTDSRKRTFKAVNRSI
jgi:O-antigen ligase